MRYNELYQLLEDSGWKKTNKTNHYWYSKSGFKSFPVARHPGKEVPKGTLNAILKQAGLK